MARPRAADHDAQRDRILASAVHAFARNGYPSASMSALAEACGLSKPGLYHYYAGKEALLFDALDRYTRRLATLVAQVRARGEPAREQLAGLVRALLHEYRSSQDYHVALLNDVKYLAEPQRERIKAQQRVVVDAFAQAIARAYPQRVTPVTVKPVTMALLGMINFTFAWLRADGAISYDEFAELAVGLWERGLSGPANAAADVGPPASMEISR